MGQSLQAPSGEVTWVDDAHLQNALANGYKPISTSEANTALTAPEDTESGVGGAIKAGASSFASGATLGLSDVGLSGLLNRGDLASMKKAREDHPYVSTASNIAGAVVPAMLSDGASLEASLAELTPSGFVSRIGANIAERSGGGLLGTAAAGAFEGAAQNAGSYVSDAALGDRDLSAEGFLGAMGKGALYGGVAGGALSVAHNGLIAARRLIPEAEATPEAIAAAKSAARDSIRDSVETSNQLGRTGLKEIDRTTRETNQFLADLEAERAAALEQRGLKAPEASAPEVTAPKLSDEVPKISEKQPMPPEAKELLAKWREKYGGGAVDYDAANAAARRGRLAEWAQDFEPKNPEDEAIKAYFENPQDPLRTQVRVGGDIAPPAVKRAANDAAAKASHDAYIAEIADATNVSKSGTELMARSMYAARKAAARALDDVYTAYRAGTPIADITAAATKKLGDQLHELAAAREDMIKSLAKNPSDLTAQLQATKAALDSGKTLGQRILEGAPKQASPDEIVANALGKSKDVNADIADIAPKITRYEAAKAQLTEALGDKATPEAIAHAQAFRQAQQEAEAGSARTVAQASETLDKAARGVPLERAAGGSSIFSGLAKKAGDYGAAYEALRAMGVPLPDPKAIPVIGPLLSAFLKAKLLGKVAGKFGGSFAATAEGTIAAKSAETRNRVNAAIDSMLGGAARATGKLSEAAGAAALGHKLFDTGDKKPYSSEPAQEPLEQMYQARMAELTAAMKPGAIEEQIRSRITTSDPSIVDSIIAAETAKLKWLYSVAPKPDAPAYPGQPERPPSKAEMQEFGTTLAAYHDPAGVFEKVAAGGTARPAEVDCVENCYPKIYAEAQKTLVEKLAEAKTAPSYMRRVAVSSLLGIPVDATMAPERAASLQSGFVAPPPPQSPPSPHPTLTADVSIGQRTLTRLDR